MNHSVIFPGLDADQQDSAQVAALACSQVHPESALPSRAGDCPLCGGKQVQVCRDYNNPAKSYVRCRECKCTGPLSVWNRRAASPAPTSWTPASNPPDADITVMLALADGEVWQGYFDGEGWIEVSGLRLQPGRVTYWQHTPKHPEDRA